MKNLLVLATFLIFASSLYSQSDKNVEENQFKVNFLAPSIEYEKGIRKNETLNFELGTGFALRGGSEIGTDFGFFPYVEGQYRYYYNMKRRVAKKKRIAANTGNYFSASILYTSGNSIFGDLDLSSNSNWFIGPLYGLQRTYKRGFNYGLEFGLGYYQNDVDGGVSARIDFSIGWVLNKNPKK